MALESIGAYAVRRSDPDNPLLADSEQTLNKVIALRWVGRWEPPPGCDVSRLQALLLAESWGDAVVEWMNLSDDAIDVFPSGIVIHEARDYPDDEFGLRIQTSPLFARGT